MIHIHSIRITDGKKCYKPRIFKREFRKNLEEVTDFEAEMLKNFINRKYKDGLPASRDMKLNPILVNATYITIPDREFLFYLVEQLKFKSIPPEIIKLFKK